MILDPQFAPWELVKYFVALLALINPIEGVAVYLGMARQLPVERQRGFVARTSIAVFLLLIVSLLLGGVILSLFGVSINNFQLAGGLLLLLIALKLALPSDTPTAPIEPSPDKAVVPLAIPILVGPGVIALVILYGTYPGSALDWAALVVMMVLASLIVFVSLLAANRFGSRIPPMFVTIATRILGLLVAAIAVEMMTASLLRLFPGLGPPA